MTLYEDRIVTARLAEKAAAKGHVIVTPKRESVTRLSQLSPEESAHLFQVASYTAAILFQGIQAEGTNILVNETKEQLELHVVARTADDGLDFTWTPTQIDEGAMQETEERIRDKTFTLPHEGSKEHEAAPTEAAGKKEQVLKQAEEEENYLLQQLIRIP